MSYKTVTELQTEVCDVLLDEWRRCYPSSKFKVPWRRLWDLLHELDQRRLRVTREEEVKS